jgi:nucleoside-diphosphate-sugar epimerase
MTPSDLPIDANALPATIPDERTLEQWLSEPTPAATQAMARVAGDVIVLGAGGKMGLSLTTMLRRASDRAGVSRRIVAVSRFGDRDARRSFDERGIETLAGDLLDERFIAQLPPCENVIFMTGMKFGSQQNAPLTWAMNVYLPALVCRHFAGSRLLAFSTGNVYPLVAPETGGSVETDPLGPVGEYAMTAVGRERMFQYFSQRERLPVVIVRLNYAVEMRYGVLADLARQVFAGETVDLSMGYANVIWQGDANAMSLCALADAAVPPTIVNVAGPEIFRTRQVCEALAERLGMPVRFANEPAPTALLNNASYAFQRYGRPRVTLDKLIDWTAQWVAAGGASLNKPTHFQARDGRF